MSKESERVIDLVDRAQRHELPIEDLLTFNAAMNNAAEPLARQVEHLETTNRALIEALKRTERFLNAARETIEQAKGESDDPAGLDDECGAYSPNGFVCTLKPGHSGHHEADTLSRGIIDRWPNEN